MTVMIVARNKVLLKRLESKTISCSLMAKITGILLLQVLFHFNEWKKFCLLLSMDAPYMHVCAIPNNIVCFVLHRKGGGIANTLSPPKDKTAMSHKVNGSAKGKTTNNNFVIPHCDSCHESAHCKGMLI